MTVVHLAEHLGLVLELVVQARVARGGAGASPSVLG
eukprot:CAMPEP_0183343490 /NCGR_PEP_ID=MMETSP0164_2-20130417/9397_1 /TAXON_ID=221442 /ORGANISM="Coccolithus pelagicus ssp braarudi, Strain PLY182g" /LENGTH=35 /DNA_ID= /DNA_START= /DNA_END= /DNA_ORIENTATION=